MKRRASSLAFVIVAIALALGFSSLWRLRFSRGDVYPPYSSLRADPLGTRAFHDALGLLPGSDQIAVERSLKPLAKTRPEPPRTLILAGLDRHAWLYTDARTIEKLDAAVRAGSRLVLAFRATPFEAPAPARRHSRSSRAEKENRSEEHSSDEQPDDATEDGEENDKPSFDWKTSWQIALSSDADETPDAIRNQIITTTTDAQSALIAGFPGVLPWRSGLTFDLAPGQHATRRTRATETGDTPWQVLYTRANRPVLVERTLGKGTLVFASDSFFLSNEALQRDRATSLLAWLVGPCNRVVFEESHLGVEEDTGIAALARRYGLGAAFVTLLLFAVLFVWRRMACFVPPPAEEAVVSLDYRPTAGIEALLRRSVPCKDLATTCLTEWQATARPEDIARASTAIAPHAPHPAEAHNAVLKALRRR